MKFKKNLLIFLSIHLFCFSLATQYSVATAETEFKDSYQNTYNPLKYEDILNTPCNTEINIQNLSTEEKTVTGNTKHYITWDNDNIDTSKYKVEIYAQPYIKYIPATDEDVANIVANIDNIPWKETKMPAVKCCTTDSADCGTVINFSDIYQTYIDNLNYSQSLEEWEDANIIANCLDVIGRYLKIGTPAGDIANKYQNLYFYLNDDKYAQYIKFSRVKYYARYISDETFEQIVYEPIYVGKNINIKNEINETYTIDYYHTVSKIEYNGKGTIGIIWKKKQENKNEYGNYILSPYISKIVNKKIEPIEENDIVKIEGNSLVKIKNGKEETRTVNFEININKNTPTLEKEGLYLGAQLPNAGLIYAWDGSKENEWKNNPLEIPFSTCAELKLPDYSKLIENDATITRPSGGSGEFIGPTQKPTQKPAPDDEEDSEKDKEATSKHKTDEDGTKNTKDILYYVKKIYKLLKAWFIFDAIDKIWNELKEIVKDEIDEKVKVATQTADIAASRFPFCVVAIPITVLNAIATDPVTPGADKTTIPIKFEKTKIGNIEFKGYEYKLKLDFKPFNNIAKVTRACIYLLFLMYLGTRTMRVYNAFIKE